MRKKLYITRQLLRELGIKKVEFDECGPEYLVRSTKVGEKEIHRHPITTKHKYGKDLTYMYFTFNINGKLKHIPVADIAYLMYHPECNGIPRGYEVDHIDNNPLNNLPDNLQLLTHADNIKRRPVACNHYAYIYGTLEKEIWD